uniref:RING-type domain-containing protein n=1 Tax=Davidia involucrata TaxID=16924 RepID=A0A5B7ACE4_DAVIN
MESGGGGSRRRQSLSDEKTDSPNLRDFLRVKDDDDDGRNSLAGLTLRAVLSNQKRLAPGPGQPNRTLLDIIRDDPNGGFKDNKKSWKAFRDKLRLRRAGAAWTSSVPIPASDVPMHNNNNRMVMRQTSARFSATPAVNSEDPTPELPSLASLAAIELNSVQSNNRAMMLRRDSSRIGSTTATREGHFDHAIDRNGSLNSGDNNADEPAAVQRRRVLLREEMLEEPETEEEVGESPEEPTAEEPVRMSLMALLAETDRQMGLDGSTYMMDEEDEEEEEEERESGGGDYNNCCVCMVRHKGAAFIPCGHTFCRLCSRELWVQRGNCPLCNGFILEILDIF